MNEFTGTASSLGVIIIALVLLRLIAVEKRLTVLSRVDAKLDLLLKHANLEFDPFQNLPREVANALQRGEKIEAIKHYREATGVGLKEAKDFVEEIQRREGIDP